MKRLLLLLACLVYVLPATAQGTAQAFEPPTGLQQMVFHGSMGAYLVLGWTDGQITELAINSGDFDEANPAAALLFERFGTTHIEAWKLGVTIGITALLEFVWWKFEMSRRMRWIVTGVAVFAASFQGLAVRSNNQVVFTGSSFVFDF